MSEQKNRLRPKLEAKTHAQSVPIEETFRKNPGQVKRVKTSLALNEETYNRLRIHALTNKVQLKDIFDEAMELYIEKHL